jgi:hypothetical protein
MRGHVVMLAATLAWFVSIETAEAKLDILVDKATQRMLVIQDGYIRYMWPVSTGRDSMQTPNGVYTPQRLERNWFSSAYYDSPMPFSIFFHHGYAIHGSYAIDRLGGPASHGCVRLHPHHAAILFDLVQQEGPGRTTIEVTDQGRPAEPPSPGQIAALRGANAPVPSAVRYREALDAPEPPLPLPPPPGNRPMVMKNGPPPPQLSPPPRPAPVATRAPAGGAGDVDVVGPSFKPPKEYVSRSRPKAVEAPPVPELPPKVIEASKVAERSASEPAQSAPPSSSSIKLLPASCWSGSASRWQWWASNQSSCR